MINKEKIKKILESYDLDNISIGSLGGHSSLDVCRGAKDEGFKTVVVCQKGREKTYSKYFASRNGKGIVDEIIIVDSFADIVKPDIQKQLRELNTIFIHSRYFWVYCNFDEIEKSFDVPIFGTRSLMPAEERDQPKNQYFILEEAGIRIPRRFARPEDIDCLAIVKASEAGRSYEREFFYVNTFHDFVEKSTALLKAGKITQEGLSKAIIEEFIIGPQVNLNFFYSPIDDELELIGTDTRRQTNIDGMLRLTAKQQLSLGEFEPKYVENGHYAVTLKESLVEKAFEIGERFVKATKKHYPPGIIGPFALQAAVTSGPPKEEFVVFDCSMRIPGSPGTRFTPYSGYLYGKDLSVGRRIAMELKLALDSGKITETLT